MLDNRTLTRLEVWCRDVDPAGVLAAHVHTKRWTAALAYARDRQVEPKLVTVLHGLTLVHHHLEEPPWGPNKT